MCFSTPSEMESGHWILFSAWPRWWALNFDLNRRKHRNLSKTPPALQRGNLCDSGLFPFVVYKQRLISAMHIHYHNPKSCRHRRQKTHFPFFPSITSPTCAANQELPYPPSTTPTPTSTSTQSGHWANEASVVRPKVGGTRRPRARLEVPRLGTGIAKQNPPTLRENPPFSSQGGQLAPSS